MLGHRSDIKCSVAAVATSLAALWVASGPPHTEVAVSALVIGNTVIFAGYLALFWPRWRGCAVAIGFIPTCAAGALTCIARRDEDFWPIVAFFVTPPLAVAAPLVYFRWRAVVRIEWQRETAPGPFAPRFTLRQLALGVAAVATLFGADSLVRASDEARTLLVFSAIFSPCITAISFASLIAALSAGSPLFRVPLVLIMALISGAVGQYLAVRDLWIAEDDVITSTVRMASQFTWIAAICAGTLLTTLLAARCLGSRLVIGRAAGAGLDHTAGSRPAGSREPPFAED